MYFWIIGGILLAVYITASVVRRHRENDRRQASYDAWCIEERTKWLKTFDNAKRGNRLDWAHISEPSEKWKNEEVVAALQEIADAKDRAQKEMLADQRRQAVMFYNSLRKLTEARERWIWLSRAPGATSWIHDGDVTLKEYKIEALGPYIELLLQEARSGNFQSFADLYKIVKHSSDSVFYGHLMGTSYVYPDDWDEMLVGFYKDPTVEQFHNQPDFAPSQILLVATEAARMKDFVRAKLVLAYCTKSEKHNSGYGDHSHSQLYWPYRDAVGVNLFTELAAFVDAVHVERHLFQESAAMSIVE